MARSTRRNHRPGPESEGGRVVVLLVLGLALLAGACYAAAYLAASDKVPVGTQVRGVDIGGHTPASAAAVLRDGLDGRARAPFAVVLNGRTMRVSPQQVGLGVDYAATVRAAGAARSWSPERLWAYYTGGSDLDPVKRIDRRRLATLVEHLDQSDGIDPTDGAVTFHRSGFVVTPPQDGLQVDPKGAAGAFLEAYLTDDPHVQLPLVATPPAVDAAAVHRFVMRFANPATASAVTLLLGDETVRLQPSSYAGLLGTRTAGHRLQPTVDAAGLSAVVGDRLGGRRHDAPQDARIVLADGTPQVVGSRPGATYAPDDLATALVAAIGAPDRTARVRATREPASFTTADARALGITDQISSATVRLPRGSRVDGLAAAAASLDGTVVRPGASLSLRARLGGGVPDDPAATQLATATFNAAWLGGLRIRSHATVPSFTGRYPMGRDATLADGQDLAFTDSTSYGVLVAVAMREPSASDDGSLTVSLWSTPRWTVTSSHSTPADVVASGRDVRRGQGCRERDGRPGFDVTVTRTFARPGSGDADHSTSYAVHYAPVAAVVCRGPRH